MHIIVEGRTTRPGANTKGSVMTKKRSAVEPRYADGSPVPDGTPVGDTTQGNGERTPEKPEETKREKFLRLARRRVPKAVKAIEQVANLFRRTMYDCEERHLLETLRMLNPAVAKLRSNFDGTKKAEEAVVLFQEDSPAPSSAG